MNDFEARHAYDLNPWHPEAKTASNSLCRSGQAALHGLPWPKLLFPGRWTGLAYPPNILTKEAQRARSQGVHYVASKNGISTPHASDARSRLLAGIEKLHDDVVAQPKLQNTLVPSL